VLEAFGVDSAGDQEVVTDAGRVPVLLRRPPVHPYAPGSLAAERVPELPVVAGKIVLGEQIQLQGGAGDRGEPGLLDGPRLAAEDGEVPALTPRDVLVRHPVLGRGQVPVEVLLDRGLELREQCPCLELRH
jgi:hypothetical protein